MDSVIEYALDAVIYVASALVLVAGVIVVKDWLKHRKSWKYVNNTLESIKADNQAIKKYMKAKGVDDFLFDCKRWQKKGYITIEARAMLDARYQALGELGANGEREAAYNAIKELKPPKVGDVHNE